MIMPKPRSKTLKPAASSKAGKRAAKPKLDEARALKPTRRDELLQQLAAVVRFSDDAIFSISAEGRINSWNPAAQQIFGYLPAEALEHDFNVLFPADRQADCQQVLNRIRSGEHVRRFEVTAMRRDRQRILVSLTISPIYLRAHGRIAGASIIARDITEQKEAEEKLRTSEAFYHSLVENLPQFIFRKDLDLRITFANQLLCQMLGHPLEKVIGKTDYDFFPPDMAAKYQSDDRRVIETGEPFDTVEVNQPPGAQKIYVNVCKTPIRDANAQIIGVQGIFWDITASRQAEIALRHSEERYRTLLNSVTDYIYTVELMDGKPVATRHGPGCLAVTGYSDTEYAAAPYLWYQMIHPDDREAVVAQLEKVLAGRAEPLEHRIVHRDGTVRWVRNTQVPRLDETGRVVVYDGLISDITERKVAEEKLRQANAELSLSRDRLMKALSDLHQSHEELKAAQMLLIRAEKMESVGRLAAGVAHEVKNPLAILLSGLEYLRELPEAREGSLAMVLKDMREALRRADSVIHGLLDFAASQELGVQPENVNEVLDRPLSLLRHDFARNGIAVKRQTAADLPLVRMDRNKIEQVFLNLFINAQHAMPDGGHLTVRTLSRRLEPGETVSDQGSREAARFSPGDQVVLVEVIDTGVGIPPDKLPKLFEPFFTTKPTGKGTGLGLAISKKILEMHGAYISIQNCAEGGVKVTVTFKAETKI